MKNNAVWTNKIRNNAITRGKIAPGAVTQDKLGADVTDVLQKGANAAGQSCSAGEFVTGFDADGSIICSGMPTMTPPLTLQNDSYRPGGSAVVRTGFVAGDEAAATLGPMSGTSTLETVELLLGGPGTIADVTLKIYQDLGTADPGTELFSDTFQLTSSDTSLQVIDLSGDGVVVNGGNLIRVSIVFDVIPTGAGLATNGGDGIPNRNWVNLVGGGGWAPSSTITVNDNWTVRATVAPL